MKSLCGTKTADNLARAFAGESQARNRYTFYSEVAEKEKHFHVSEVFKTIADQEKAHAQVFFNLLVEGLGKAEIKVDTEYPVALGTTKQNLKFAAEGEKEEWGNAYPNFAKIAKEEGFPEVEKAFNMILSIEQIHEKKFLDLHDKFEKNTIYSDPQSKYWKCSNCGYVYEGTSAPLICPSCVHPQGYFEAVKDKYQ